MKILNKIWGMGLLALLLTAFSPRQASAQGGYVSNQVFYDELSPYGTWVYDDRYGDVWIPDAEEGFSPYGSRGHWVLTEYGNTWVSDYPWGWATFHYGRWFFDDYYGWMWVPDNEWGPAWVNWRQGGGYYGWAPLSPGININVSIGSNYSVPDYYWNYAPEVYINSPRIYDYYVPRAQVVRMVNRTTIINNTVVINNRNYIGGPRFDDIRRVTRSAPQIYRVNDSRRPGAINVNNNTVNIYRPNITINKNARPSRVVDGRAYRDANPDNRIAVSNRRGIENNRANTEKLIQAARSERPDDKFVRVNNDSRRGMPRGNDNNNRDGGTPNRNNGTPDNNSWNGRRGQGRQPSDQQNDQNPARRQQTDEQIQQREARRQQMDQNRTPRGVDAGQDQAQRDQQNQEREQRRQQMQQQWNQQRQQQGQQDQLQREQRRQQQQADRENANQRQQQMWRDQQNQQEQAQRQQQQMQRDQQRQQQIDQRRGMEQQQRQQEQQMQRDQQRQQQMEQQQMQRDQQRQQQMEQQRQQQQQQQQIQRDQQRQQQQPGGDGGGRGRRGIGR